MKTSTLILTLFLVITTQLNSQIFEENFDYQSGLFSHVFSDWNTTGSGGTEAVVVDGSLSYTNYISSGLGRKLLISSDSAQDYTRSLGTQISSGTVYVSLLLSVLNDTDLSGVSTDGDYFIHFEDGRSHLARLHIRKGSNNAVCQLGLAKQSGSEPLFLTSKELNYSETYLVVLSYTFNTATQQDDEIKLWVNPDLSGNEPSPDLSFIDALTDANKFDDIDIRQGTNTPNAYIDGIRVSTSWSTAPLPVELTSFTANQESNGINLQWETSNEINNYGFDIERSVESSNEFQKIGFINGHGNSNSPKSYSFLDDKFTEIFKNQESSKGEIQYRLKQIDFDGNYEYSKIITVETLHATFLPSKFELLQNYPNPFNPVTTIKYSIPAVETRRGVSVILKIYDILGNEIATLVNEQKQAGEYEVNFNASNLAGGIYLYRLQTASGVVLTKKLILLK